MNMYIILIIVLISHPVKRVRSSANSSPELGSQWACSMSLIEAIYSGNEVMLACEQVPIVSTLQMKLSDLFNSSFG